MSTLINSNFNNLKPSSLLAQAQTIVTAMTGNPAFPEPWSATVPPLAQIQKDLAAFQDAVTATAVGDRTRIAERTATGAVLVNDLGQLALYVQGIANGNQEMLATTGYPLRQRHSRNLVVDVPQAPVDVRTYPGIVSGSLLIRSPKVEGAASYDVQIATADPTVESNWTAAGSYTSCRRIELSGLTAFKTYWVRMRGLGSAGPGAWSVPVSLPVV
jgi:hypothetical protein